MANRCEPCREIRVFLLGLLLLFELRPQMLQLLLERRSFASPAAFPVRKNLGRAHGGLCFGGGVHQRHDDERAPQL